MFRNSSRLFNKQISAVIYGLPIDRRAGGRNYAGDQCYFSTFTIIVYINIMILFSYLNLNLIFSHFKCFCSFFNYYFSVLILVIKLSKLPL